MMPVVADVVDPGRERLFKVCQPTRWPIIYKLTQAITRFGSTNRGLRYLTQYIIHFKNWPDLGPSRILA